jgi:hypothetical protein
LKIVFRIDTITSTKTSEAGIPTLRHEAEQMSKYLIGAGLAALSLMCMAGVASAGPIEGACMKSNRDAANRTLCSCIQQVADITLNGSDQRRAASFFKDPDQAQKVRMSKTDQDDAFWERYKSFGEQASLACAG